MLGTSVGHMMRIQAPPSLALDAVDALGTTPLTPIDLSILHLPIPLIFELKHNISDTCISLDIIHSCRSASNTEKKHLKYKAFATILVFVSSVRNQFCDQRAFKASFIDTRTTLHNNKRWVSHWKRDKGTTTLMMIMTTMACGATLP